MRIFSLVNQKGGVGKTTSSVNLAAAAAANAQGKRRAKDVLLIDLDPQANSSAMLGVRNPALSIYDALVNPKKYPLESVITETKVAGLHLAPGHLALAGLAEALRQDPAPQQLLKELLEPFADRYSAVFIDTPPAMSLGPTMSLCAAQTAIVAILCEPMTMEGFTQINETINLVRRRLNPQLERRFVFTMLASNKSAQRIADDIREAFPKETCATAIPISQHLKKAVTRGGSVFGYAPTSPAADAYRALALELKL